MMDLSPGHYVGYFTVPSNMQLIGEINVFAQDQDGHHAFAVAQGKLAANME
jgi:hypothetical protein